MSGCPPGCHVNFNIFCLELLSVLKIFFKLEIRAGRKHLMRPVFVLKISFVELTLLLADISSGLIKVRGFCLKISVHTSSNIH